MIKIFHKAVFFVFLICMFNAHAAGIDPITTSGNYVGDINTSGYGINLELITKDTTSVINLTGNITADGLDNIGIGINILNIPKFIPDDPDNYVCCENNVFPENNIATVNVTGNVSGGDSGLYIENTNSSNNVATVNVTGNLSGGIAGLYIVNTNSSNNSNTVKITGDVTGAIAFFSNLYELGDISSHNTNTVDIKGDVRATNDVILFNATAPSDGNFNNSNSLNIVGNVTTSDGSQGIVLVNNGYFNSNTVNIVGDVSLGLGVIGLENVANYTDDVDTVNLSAHNTNTVNITGNINGSTAGGYMLKLTNDDYTSFDTNLLNIKGDINVNEPSSDGVKRILILSNTISSNSTNTVNLTGNITNICGFVCEGISLNNTLNSTNSSNTVNMTGNILTGGYLVGYGVTMVNGATSNSSNTVNLTGNVTTSGLISYAVILANLGGEETNSNQNTLNMTGYINTSGDGSTGIFIQETGGNDNNTVNLKGSITTTGNEAPSPPLPRGPMSSPGIFISSQSETAVTNASTIVNMTGNITTSGNGSGEAGAIGSHGIYIEDYATSNTNQVNIIGNITTTGEYADGINLFSQSTSSLSENMVNLTGRLSATGLGARAIFASNDSATSTNTVQLNKGSSVIGSIVGEGAHAENNLLKLNLGAGASYDFETIGFMATDLNGRPMVTGSAHAAGVGNVSTATQSLYERTAQITHSLDDRLRAYNQQRDTVQPYWVNAYYSDSSRNGQGLTATNLNFNQYRSGITAGFNIDNTLTPIELVANYEYGKLNIDDGNQGIQSNAVMAGFLFPNLTNLIGGTLGAKALVGYSDFNGDRKVLTNDVAYNGSRNVTANYQSSHLNLGSAWTKILHENDKAKFDVLIGMDLNTQHIKSYSESDLFTWQSRTLNQLQERFELGLQMKPIHNPLSLYGRIGIEHRDLLSGENQNYTIVNQAVSFNDPNQQGTYVTMNAGAYYPLTKTLNAYANVRYYGADKNIDSLSGGIGIAGQF